MTINLNNAKWFWQVANKVVYTDLQNHIPANQSLIFNGEIKQKKSDLLALVNSNQSLEQGAWNYDPTLKRLYIYSDVYVGQPNAVPAQIDIPQEGVTPAPTTEPTSPQPAPGTTPASASYNPTTLVKPNPFSFSVSGFIPGETINLSVMSPGSSTPQVGSIVANSQGAYMSGSIDSATLVVGQYRATFNGATSGRSATATLNVSNATAPIPAPAPVAAQPASQPSATSRTSVGTNLPGIAGWEDSPFINVLKSATGYYETVNFPMDADGYPTRLTNPVPLLLFQDIDTTVGRYVVKWDGEGTIGEWLNASVVSQSSNRQIVDIRAGNVIFKILTTNPANYLKNLRICRIEHESLMDSGEIFNPKFLELHQPYKACLRFMDWGATNHSEQETVDQMPRATQYSYSPYGKLKTSAGVPIEIMIALANKLSADAWFCIPHKATETYIREYAIRVKNLLNPVLTAYVEYSNEVWNWQFMQAQYALQQGKARWGDDVGDAHIQWAGMMGAICSRIWKEVFGANRIKGVLATQTGWKGLEESLLYAPKWVAEGNPKPHTFVDCYSITGYLSAKLITDETVNTVLSWRNDPDGGFGKFFTQLRNGSLLGSDFDVEGTIRDVFPYHANVAKSLNLEMNAYEGGSHSMPFGNLQNNTAVVDFLLAAHQRPEFEQIYTDLLNGWKAVGGTVFNHFVSYGRHSKYGCWGAIESLSSTPTGRHKALMSFINANPG